MTTTTAPRIPANVLNASEVAVRLPLEEGAVAHRMSIAYREIPGRRDASKELIYLAACAPDDDPCAAFSAAWANQHGAIACTERQCFPNATP